MTKLKTCPFCGGKAVLQIRDNEGNYHGILGCEYEKNAWSGLSYSIGHYHEDNKDCPIASYQSDRGQMGVYLYDSAQEAIEDWNRRVNND